MSTPLTAITDDQLNLDQIATALNVTKSSADKRARRESWPHELTKVRGGRAKLFRASALPPDVKVAVIRAYPPTIEVTRDPVADALSAALEETPAGAPAPFVYDRDALWAHYERKTDKQKAEAARKCALLREVAALVDAGALGLAPALQQVGAAHGVSWRTLQNWHHGKPGRPGVKHYARADWLAALAPGHAGRSSNTECAPEAWELFKALYLRLHGWNAAVCHRKVAAAARESGWAWPALRTVQRWIHERLDDKVVVLLREGEEALMAKWPDMQRDRSVFAVMEAVNGDGVTWKPYCVWPDGAVARPCTWGWQDLASGKWLAWRTDVSENADMLRLAYGDLVDQWGIPPHAYIDNTRAAANKWMTGRTVYRFRWKAKESDPIGIMPQMGTEAHFVTPHHGQAKPIERSNRDLRALIDRHPKFDGRGSQAKPIPIDEFLTVMDNEIRHHNATPGRRTQACGGVLSFDDAFAKGYASATITKATAEQRRLWLLAVDKVRANRDSGHIVLGRGPQGENRYWHEALTPYAGQELTVRFDPQDLGADVHVYTLDGRYICAAPCGWRAGFNDTAAARDYGRERTRFKKAAKKAAAAERRMSALTAAAQIPDEPEGETPESTIVAARFPAHKRAEVDGQRVDADTGEVLVEDDDEAQMEANLRARLRQIGDARRAQEAEDDALDVDFKRLWNRV